MQVTFSTWARHFNTTTIIVSQLLRHRRQMCHHSAVYANWTFKFRKVVRQQIWGEVVQVLFHLQFITECNSERIIKIGLHLPKLLYKQNWRLGFWLTVHSNLWGSISTKFLQCAVCGKKDPLKFFVIFLATARNFYMKFHTFITHS